MGCSFRAIVASTIIVFVATWLLHSYQWFWLRGGFPITIPDILFWGILGGLVVLNSLREVRRGRKRTPNRHRWTPSLAFRTVATFATICVLWSLWSAESLIEWLWMLRAVANAEPIHIAAVAGALILALSVAGVPWDTVLETRSNPLARYATLTRSTALLGMLVLAQPAVTESTLPVLAPTMSSLTHSSLNAQDMERRLNGYYENLDGPSRRRLQLWNATATPTASWQDLSDLDW